MLRTMTVDATRPIRSALEQLTLEAGNMADSSATAEAPLTPSTPTASVLELSGEEILRILKKEASKKLSAWEAKPSDIRQQLAELMTGVEVQFIQYALAKHAEIENLKAQIETYKTEVDLLKQDNTELAMDQEAIVNGGIRKEVHGVDG
ncbi:hypothetical protein BU23DRAFT_567261 [Bimuria novae-zelandiae CBS 107.79]|uniref:Uncharacterized protein n=1 Tax=Bimuria novae-zelandiae CBS 107.79 TaxID=1447943 RepID=A0A6A5VBQ1_9PLEO|nr:hypothetical protein BU23DRAFT_567261 [Bimuria novae-zelandiae CBS 107.79]